jgi:crotonobetainyl-CoA:carnitine CoA-transferase CaiB-like acyl-CoA transferase
VSAPGPLAGLVVVDCSHGTAGPRATGLLADYGADVLWVERPGGDPLRERQPAAAAVFNRGKRSVVLDLAVPADHHRLLGLVDGADVFVESWQPGVADRLGVGWGALHARNPRLVHCSISGFGQEGRLRDEPGHEAIVHALAGTMADQVGHRPAPVFQGLPFAAIGAAHLALVGVLGALLRRADDGHGRRVETSLLDGAMAYHSMLWGESDAGLARAAGGAPKGTTGTRLVTRSFHCADDEVLGIHTGATGAFSRFLAVLGLDAEIPPAADGVDIGVPLTPEQADLLATELPRRFRSATRAEWLDRLLAADVCAVEHLRPGQVFDAPQARHSGMVVSVDDPVLGPVEQVAPAIVLPSTPGRVAGPAPPVGSHSSATGANVPTPAPADPIDERPLFDGVRILDLGAFFAGPFSSRLLADLGADVVKLEPLAGDPLRGIERPFASAQAGKRAVAADAKHPEVRPIVEALVRWADVVHHNLRPGAAERLGLGYDEVHALNPRAVYLYAPGWGSTGPHRMRQSFAPMLSGYVGVTYEVAGEYNDPMPPIGNEDPGNGLLGAVAILLALLVRRSTGEGAYVENPQLHAAMGHVAHIVRTPAGEVVGAGRLDLFQHGFGPWERLYETADGWICIVAHRTEQRAATADLLGVDVEADDEAVAHRLAAAFAERTVAGLVADLRAAGVPVAEPIGSGSPVHMHDPDHRSIGRVAEVEHPELGTVREPAVLVRVSGAEVPPHRAAPLLGQHTEEVLVELGFSPDLIADLSARGILRSSPPAGARQG